MTIEEKEKKELEEMRKKEKKKEVGIYMDTLTYIFLLWLDCFRIAQLNKSENAMCTVKFDSPILL